MASRLSLLLLVVCSLAVAQAQLRLYDLRASNLPSDAFGKTDAYIKISCGSSPMGTTTVSHNTVNPWWQEEFASLTAKAGDVMELEVFDEDVFFDDLVGSCTTALALGTHQIECHLAEGGILRFSYTLS